MRVMDCDVNERMSWWWQGNNNDSVFYVVRDKNGQIEVLQEAIPRKGSILV